MLSFLSVNEWSICVYSVAGIVTGLIGLLAIPRGRSRPAWRVRSRSLASASRWIGWLRHPQVLAAGLCLGGVLLLVWQVHALDQAAAKELECSAAFLASCPPVLEIVPQAEVSARTDAGNPVEIYKEALHKTPAEEENEASPISLSQFTTKPIQTGPPTLRYNCNGWVFTGGRYWLETSSVERILKDNHYAMVSYPVQGDLIIFRNSEGEVIHSGLVYRAEEDGLILVESKWGSSARYVHTLTNHIYARYHYSYYHSPREGGHLLRCFDASSPRPKSHETPPLHAVAGEGDPGTTSMD